MTLSTMVIDRLFERLSATYGSEFKNKWSALDLNSVKSAWAHELSHFADNLKAIGWALENLPERCPNVIEFRNLCRQSPRPDSLALGAPKASPDVVDRELAKIALTAFKPPVDERGTVDHKRWAKKLKARHEAGEKLSMLQIKMYKGALE